MLRVSCDQHRVVVVVVAGHVDGMKNDFLRRFVINLPCKSSAPDIRWYNRKELCAETSFHHTAAACINRGWETKTGKSRYDFYISIHDLLLFSTFLPRNEEKKKEMKSFTFFWEMN